MTRIPITRPDLGEREAEAAARVVRSGWLLQGAEVEAFEAELAAAVGAEHGVAVASGTIALELSLRALGVSSGDEVVTVSHSFIATANAVRAVGARPVFVDVEPGTLGMDPRLLAGALTPRTRAVLCVHQLGLPCAVEPIADMAARHGLPLVEDAACALGSELLCDGSWRRIGLPFGAVACFSFHPRKVITTGEGGMITTSDAALARRLRRLRQHGIEDGACVEAGINARLTDVQAAIGRPQLERLAASVTRRRALAARLSETLAANRVLAPFPEPPGVRWNWQSYPALLRSPARRAAEILEFLAARGVGARPGVSNAHHEPAYAGSDSWRAAPGGLAVSECLSATSVLLPLFHAMTDAELDEVRRVTRELDIVLGG
jgi:perosamine synthetase